MLHVIKMWLKVAVEERDETGKRRITGGKDNDRGTPQGSVVSPLLANLYMNRMLKGWRNTKRGEQFQAKVVNYADDCAPRAQRAEEGPMCVTAGLLRVGPSEPADRSRFQTTFGGRGQKPWS